MLAFLNQSFQPLDILRVFVVIFLECALSSDNAIALAVLTQQLPKKKQRKALWIGLVSAFFLRALALLFLSFFIHYFWIQLLGALYLIYLSISFSFKSRSSKTSQAIKSPSFWKVVMQIELTDFVFALDSMLAALGLISINISHGWIVSSQLWIVYLGGLIGLVAMRFAAQLFSYLIHRFQRLQSFSHILIGWVGLKLIFEVVKNGLIQKGVSLQSEWILTAVEWFFWVGIIIVIGLSFIPKASKK